jgi:O-acetyl-ADP-ribose deacetylase (regulator of RNase III)
LAAAVAIAEVRNFARDPASLREVIFRCFSSEDYTIYQRLLREKRA